MARSIWTGAISFGLVTVPVKMYSAVSSKTVRFHQLNKATGSRIAQKRVDPTTGDEVDYADIVKGYELAPDRYVVIEPNDLESLDPKKTKTIEIEDFVDISEIDPIYYDHAYYLAPGPGGAKPYVLLMEAMKKAGKAGIAKVVIRSKEQLVALRPIEGTVDGAPPVMGMTTMNFADEIVDPRRLDELPDDVEISKRELDIAEQLVQSLAGDWDPTKYTDTYRAQVVELIERKAAGEEIAVQPQVEEDAPVPDLMAALKASLDAVRSSGSNGGEQAAAEKPAAKKRAPAKKAPARKKSPAKK